MDAKPDRPASGSPPWQGRAPRHPTVATPSSSALETRRLMARVASPTTGFFREPWHFADLQQRVGGADDADELRVWSAACGCGEEAYSIAMLLAATLAWRPWSVIGTDIAAAGIAEARRALYPLERARLVPEAYLKNACLRGTGRYDGQLLIGPDLRSHVDFVEADLREPLPQPWPRFNAIFLRHALGRYGPDTRVQVARRVLEHLKPGGVLYVGHGESLAALGLPTRELAPAVHAIAA